MFWPLYIQDSNIYELFDKYVQMFFKLVFVMTKRLTNKNWKKYSNFNLELKRFLNTSIDRNRCGSFSTASWLKVIPKVKQMISWLKISCCNSLRHFKLQVLDSLVFQRNYWNKIFLFFLKILFYPIKTWFGHTNKFLFYLEKWLFSNHHIIQQSLTFIN